MAQHVADRPRDLLQQYLLVGDDPVGKQFLSDTLRVLDASYAGEQVELIGEPFFVSLLERLLKASHLEPVRVEHASNRVNFLYAPFPKERPLDRHLTMTMLWQRAVMERKVAGKPTPTHLSGDLLYFLAAYDDWPDWQAAERFAKSALSECGQSGDTVRLAGAVAASTGVFEHKLDSDDYIWGQMSVRERERESAVQEMAKMTLPDRPNLFTRVEWPRKYCVPDGSMPNSLSLKFRIDQMRSAFENLLSLARRVSDRNQSDTGDMRLIYDVLDWRLALVRQLKGIKSGDGGMDQRAAWPAIVVDEWTPEVEKAHLNDHKVVEASEYEEVIARLGLQVEFEEADVILTSWEAARDQLVESDEGYDKNDARVVAPEDLSYIEVDGKKIRFSETMANALRALRDAGNQGLTWVEYLDTWGRMNKNDGRDKGPLSYDGFTRLFREDRKTGKAARALLRVGDGNRWYLRSERLNVANGGS